MEPVTIDMPSGRITGRKQDGISSFLGIPYGSAQRWRLPEPAAPWAGVRDASVHGPASPQTVSRLDRLTGGVLRVQSEDCLCLNVWTPSCTGKRPVMVWIHGGAFIFGAGHQALYDGHKLAARDCVVVTINYRLGALGFLALAEISATGAEGIADQIMALAWVKANIASFGGDADNVTIFGESAGAMSVSALLASPLAKGLFHKAIAQSGGAHIGHDAERAARVTEALLAELNVPTSRLRELPAAAILNAQSAVLAKGRDGKLKLGGLPFQPALGQPVLPVKPIDALRAGSAAGIPLLTGSNRDEWKLFTAADPRSRFMSAATFAGHAVRLAKESAPTLLAVYREGSPYERLNAMQTDKTFMVPATRMLEAQAPFAPAYGYRFDWRSKFLGGMFGACHALEIGFVFGSYGVKPASALFGKGPAADALSTAMMDAWVAFAHTGNPGWQTYDPQSRQMMIFGDGDPYITSTPSEERRQAWDAVPEFRLGP
ncbi:MAG TPA: carboxylesterase/lipase family protein [Rhizomicrobium sp.]|jgi:para-nitrobenzyl esterase